MPSACPLPSLCLCYGLLISSSPDASVLQGMGEVSFREHKPPLREGSQFPVVWNWGQELEGDRDTEEASTGEVMLRAWIPSSAKSLGKSHIRLHTHI